MPFLRSSGLSLSANKQLQTKIMRFANLPALPSDAAISALREKQWPRPEGDQFLGIAAPADGESYDDDSIAEQERAVGHVEEHTVKRSRGDSNWCRASKLIALARHLESTIAFKVATLAPENRGLIDAINTALDNLDSALRVLTTGAQIRFLHQALGKVHKASDRSTLITSATAFAAAVNNSRLLSDQATATMVESGAGWGSDLMLLTPHGVPTMQAVPDAPEGASAVLQGLSTALTGAFATSSSDKTKVDKASNKRTSSIPAYDTSYDGSGALASVLGPSPNEVGHLRADRDKEDARAEYLALLNQRLLDSDNRTNRLASASHELHWAAATRVPGNPRSGKSLCGTATIVLTDAADAKARARRLSNLVPTLTYRDKTMGHSWDLSCTEKAQLETIASDRSKTNALRARVASAALSMLKGIKNEATELSSTYTLLESLIFKMADAGALDLSFAEEDDSPEFIEHMKTLSMDLQFAMSTLRAQLNEGIMRGPHSVVTEMTKLTNALGVQAPPKHVQKLDEEDHASASSDEEESRATAKRRAKEFIAFKAADGKAKKQNRRNNFDGKGARGGKGKGKGKAKGKGGKSSNGGKGKGGNIGKGKGGNYRQQNSYRGRY